MWLMLEFVAGLHDRFIDYHPVVTFLAIGIPIVFFYLGLKRKRDSDYDGVITFGQCFKAGMIMTLITAVFTLPLQAAFHYFINPFFFDDMIQHSVQRAVN